MMRVLVTSLIAGAVLAGCQDPAKRVAYDGHYFRAKTNKVEKQRDHFVVKVRDVARSETGARQAAYHNGVSYCLALFGSSDILWVQNPLDEEVPLRIEDDTITFEGRCPQAQQT